jgi:hypothetical protein
MVNTATAARIMKSETQRNAEKELLLIRTKYITTCTSGDKFINIY